MKNVVIIFVLLFLQFHTIMISQVKPDVKPTKVALIIGNGNYTNNPLANPVNDAKAMRNVLKKLGFVVDEYENLNQSQMKKAIDDFGEKMKNMEVGLFFYAGHGIQSQGENFLIPIDAVLKSEKYVEYDCVPANRILAAMESSSAKVNIIILDACRDNPFERSWSRSASTKGLASMNAPSGTLIAYATSPGSTASDGSGSNGLYTSAILESIQLPDITISQMFQNVRKMVMEKSDKRQVPWESTSLVGDFYFNIQKADTAIALQPVPIIPLVSLPEIFTPEISSIASSEAILKTTLSGDGGAPVIARGICYSLSPEPSFSDPKTIDGAGIGIFSSTLTGLTPNKTYYARAYAINSAGTVYSSKITIVTRPSKPNVITTKISSILPSSVITGGKVTDAGGADNVVQRGVCWDTLTGPTAEKNKTIDSTGFGAFTSNITDLLPNTTYYLRAYSKDQTNTYYGNEISFKTLKEGQFTDPDGNIYNSLKIGNHFWMTDNLKTTKYNDSTRIPNIADKQAWSSRSAPGYCWYFNDEDTYKDTIGALYNWHAVNTGKLCPIGWHVPTVREFTLLIQTLGGNFIVNPQTGVRILASYDKKAILNSGFPIRLGGTRPVNGSYESIDKKGYYWSSEQADKNGRHLQVLERALILEFEGVDKKSGLSVRCVRD